MDSPVLTIEQLAEEAARIATVGNGLPMEFAIVMANRVLDNLVCYRGGPGGKHVRPLREQDVDYLARTLQAAMLAGYKLYADSRT